MKTLTRKDTCLPIKYDCYFWNLHFLINETIYDISCVTYQVLDQQYKNENMHILISLG